MKRFLSIAGLFFLMVAFPALLLNKDLPEQPEHRDKVTAYPTELYPGENVLTFTHSTGIREIKPMLDSLATSLTEISGHDDFDECSNTVDVHVKVNTPARRINVRFMVTDCNKRRQVFSMQNRVWHLEEVILPDVEVGDTACGRFRVWRVNAPNGKGEYLDSVYSHQPQVFFSYPPDSVPPLLLPNGSTYLYTVCFAADKPGEYKFGVVHQIRREQPAAGHKVFNIADTGIVRVLPRNYGGVPSPGGALPSR